MTDRTTSDSNSRLNFESGRPGPSNHFDIKGHSLFDDAAHAFATLLADHLVRALELLLQQVPQTEKVEPVDLPPVMSVDEVARYLGIGRSVAYEAVRTGEIPSLRIGRRIRIPTQALLKRLDLS